MSVSSLLTGVSIIAVLLFVAAQYIERSMRARQILESYNDIRGMNTYTPPPDTVINLENPDGMPFVRCTGKKPVPVIQMNREEYDTDDSGDMPYA
jgi:hypothetical protein